VPEEVEVIPVELLTYTGLIVMCGCGCEAAGFLIAVGFLIEEEEEEEGPEEEEREPPIPLLGNAITAIGNKGEEELLLTSPLPFEGPPTEDIEKLRPRGVAEEGRGSTGSLLLPELGYPVGEVTDFRLLLLINITLLLLRGEILRASNIRFRSSFPS